MSTLFRKVRLKAGGSLKYKLMAYFLLLSVLPITILGIASYIITSHIMEDKVSKNAMSSITNKINIFDISNNKIIEAIINDLTASSDTLLWLQSVNDNKKSELWEYYSYDTLYRTSIKVETVISQRSDIKCMMILPKNKSTPIVRGGNEINYLDVFNKSGIYELAVKNPYKTFWNFVSDGNNRLIQLTRGINNYATDENEGVVIIYLDMSYIDDVFENAAPEEDSSDFVLDDNNNIIFSSAHNVKYTSIKQALLDTVHASKRGSLKMDINGDTKIVSYTISKSTGWILINLVPYKNINKDITDVSRVSVIVFMLCTVYAIVVAIFVYKSIYTPILKLRKGVEKFGEGDLQVRIDSGRTDELGDLSNHFDKMTQQIKKYVEDIEQQEKKKKEIEIKFLQSQITPHFLYNTLNSIKALSNLGRNKDISSMVVSLISLLRISASNNMDMITMEEEINYVKAYISIMGYRYYKKINVEYNIDPLVGKAGILKFIIQPIVENCIIHGFNDMEDDCIISIRAYKSNNSTVVEVKDNGAGMEQSMLKDINSSRKYSGSKLSKIGINNVHERIQLYFGKEYGLSYSSTLGEGTKAYIRVPFFEIGEKVQEPERGEFS